MNLSIMPRFTNIQSNNSRISAQKSKISFGEECYDGDYDKPIRSQSYIRDRKEEINDSYEKQLTSLACLADDIEMDNNTYYQQKREIERQQRIALDNID